MRIAMRTLHTFLLLVLCAVANGQIIWGIKSLAPNGHPVFSAPPTVLFQIIGADGATFTTMDTLRYDGVAADVDGLCQLQDGRLLAWRMLPNGSQAVLLDTITGDLSAFGTGNTLIGREIRGAATDGNGSVWALDALNATVIRVDTADGEVVQEVSLTLNGTSWTGCPQCDIAFSDTNCYITGSSSIYELDILTGILNALYIDTQSDPGDVLYTCNGTPSNPPPINRGLAYLPNPGTLVTFDTACEDDLFAYPLSGLSGRSELSHHIIPYFNSGGGDLSGPPPTPTHMIVQETSMNSMEINMVNGILFIDLPQHGPSQLMVEVFDPVGKLLLRTERVKSPTIAIELADVSGPLLVRVTTGHQQMSRKVIGIQ